MRRFKQLASAIFVVVLVDPMLPASVVIAKVVTYLDPNLGAAIREAIEKPTGDIYKSDLLRLTNLYACSRGTRRA